MTNEQVEGVFLIASLWITFVLCVRIAIAIADWRSRRRRRKPRTA